jgi:hypothetical protein
MYPVCLARGALVVAGATSTGRLIRLTVKGRDPGGPA